MEINEEYQFRVLHKYREWVGKPDPSGFSTQYFYAKTWKAIAKHIECLGKAGHKVLKIEEKNDAGTWRRVRRLQGLRAGNA